MREILFRAKRLDSGEWIHGDLKHGGYYDRDDMYIGVTLARTVTTYAVLPETVGQYTGLLDKNGKRIFEGDIMRGVLGDFVVKYYNSGAGFGWENVYDKNNWGESFTGFADEYEVIGNIHDNPELL